MEINSKNSNQSIRFKNILLGLNICFGALFFYIAGVIGRINTDMIAFGDISVPSQSIKGVITACVSLACVLIVCLDYKVGIWTGIIFIGISIIRMTIACFLSKSVGALPGIISSAVSLIIIFVIAYELKRIYKDSVTDLNTGLLNRRGFVIECQKKIYKKKNFHVLLVRIRNVRAVIDEMGHDYGDIIFTTVGQRIKEVTGSKSVVAKFDGREYGVLITGENDPKETAEKIVKKIGEKLVASKNDVDIDCYIPSYVGISSFPKAGIDSDSLIRYAGIAAFIASEDPNEKIKIFDEEMEDNLHHYAEIERIVKEALENNYFYLVYQPQFDFNKKLRGFETLIRLKMPDGRIISPGEFIPVSENTDNILKIDDYVLRRAMAEFKDKMISAGMDASIVLSINVSAKNMAAPDFVDRVLAIVNETGFPASCLEIEITEYSFAHSMDQTIANVNALRENGIMVALDDFGTGYTSLSQLLHLPVNLLKIDKSLVDDIETDNTNKDFVDSIIYMGHLMGCEVISEGVEQEGQLAALRDHECDFVQGFIWGKPLAFDDAVALIDNN